MKTEESTLYVCECGKKYQTPEKAAACAAKDLVIADLEAKAKEVERLRGVAEQAAAALDSELRKMFPRRERNSKKPAWLQRVCPHTSTEASTYQYNAYMDDHWSVAHKTECLFCGKTLKDTGKS